MKPKTAYPALGTNIASIRKERNFSLEELSRQSGVSIGMLSQIEQEKVNPTVAIVWKIALGLDVPVSDLLAMSEGEQVFQLIHKNESAIIERDQGRCVFYMISPLTMAERLELYTLEIKKGGKLDSPAHAKGTEEFVTVFCGKVSIQVDNKKAILEVGDSLHYNSDTSHSIYNLSEAESVLYMVVKYLQ